MSLKLQFCPEITQINSEQWDQLTRHHYPFLRYAFLQALETSGSVTAKTGWQPYHLWVTDNSTPVACMPLYIKTHSYGEYVFDWSWADAYQRYQLNYYPKLVNAIPFTPVTGPRVITSATTDKATIEAQILSALHQESQKLGLSSIHVLFPESLPARDNATWSTRHSVQFQWYNRGYSDFNDFLSHFASRKRKNVNKERRKIHDNNIVIRRFCQDSLQPEHLEFFYTCYQQTYLKRSGHEGYLNLDFFKTLFATMADNLLIVQAEKHGDPVAAALYFYDKNGLYGRYWGSLQDIDGLHFECCYYQGIEFAIANQISLFNPGTQGEHKIQRGFEPTLCYSQHWLANPQFNRAVQDFVHNEQQHIAQYQAQACSLLPFKQT